MKAFRRLLWLGLVAFFMPLSQSVAQVIETEGLTIVPTRAVEPLQILVKSDGTQGFFTGEVLSRRPLIADNLEFTLLNANHGIVWQDGFDLPAQGQRIMPFYFEDIHASETLFLSVQAYDQFGNTAGSGHKYIKFPEKLPSVSVSSSEVFLNDKSELNIDLLAENGLVRQSYIPQVKIYNGLKHFGDLIETVDQPIVILDPKQRQQLSFVLPFDQSPGVYEIVVNLLEATSRKSISASYAHTIYRPGDYFKIVDLKSYYTADDESKARLELTGLSTVVLTEPVQMRVRLQNKQNIYLDKNYRLALQPGYFTKFVDLDLPDYVSELNGSAVFYLQGKKIQTVDFRSNPSETDVAEIIAVKVSPEVDLSSIPPRVPEAKKFTLSDKQIIGVVIGCTVLLLLIIVFAWARSRWLAWVVISIGGASSTLTAVYALTVGRDVFPMVEWSNPIPAESMVFNPSHEGGFQWIPVKGRIFNFLTQSALLKEGDFNELRFNLKAPSGRNYQYKMSQELLKPNTDIYTNSQSGDYYFVLDLSAFETLNPLASDKPMVWEDGRWQLQLIFPYQQKEEEPIYLATPLDEFGFFTIDQSPPLWQWQLKKSDGDILAEADFTSQPITVSISCQDKESECMNPLQDFNVVGNFCNDGLTCNTEASRQFEVCDTAGNCTVQNLDIDGYDPVPPTIESLLFGGSQATTATEETTLSLRYSDPNKVKVESLNIPFDSELCGNKNPFFRLDNQSFTCVERQESCVLVSKQSVWRGNAINEECVPSCPDGYRFERGGCQTICGESAFDSDRLCLPFNLKINEN